MTNNTANLSLPYILAAQAQKHVTHNEALRILDSLIHLAVLDRDLAEPPALPAEGERYLVPAGATGEWEAKAGMLAAWQDGAWAFLTPRQGWLCWVTDEATLLAFDGASWESANGQIEALPMLGINASADATNRLAVSAAATLLSHEGDDHRVVVNKALAADTASLVFQTGFSGRAEIGLAGEDDFSFKVSADGTSFHQGIAIAAASGQVSFPQAPKFSATINYDQYCAADAWTKIGVNVAQHNDQLAFDAATSRFTAPAAGYYLFGGKYRFKANATVPSTILTGFGKNGADPATGSDSAEQQGPIASLVSTVQHLQLYSLAQGDTIDLRARMSGYDGYAESGSVSFWGHRIA
ncbi:DUF2793 domain-containing protein [Afifella pfennigii]|uniref:DUF2793 domain-containing protein n=1 Tax=Afifella pfennigii TaxID=209897 RepID=UPI00047CA3FF|nr:DUF2793 domain-containing protein [Afifella pfennigii]